MRVWTTRWRDWQAIFPEERRQVKRRLENLLQEWPLEVGSLVRHVGHRDCVRGQVRRSRASMCEAPRVQDQGNGEYNRGEGQWSDRHYICQSDGEPGTLLSRW